MKKLFILLTALCLSQVILAQTKMHDVWLEIPDSLTPVLNKNLRHEQLDFIDMKVPMSVKNLLRGESLLDTLTNDYLHVKLTASSEMELKLLPLNDSTSVICMVKTFSAPMAESQICFFSTDWQPLADTFGMDVNKCEVERFVAKPDTMSQEKYDNVIHSIGLKLLQAKLSPSENTLNLIMNVPLINAENKEELKQSIKQINLKWNGFAFKES